MEFLSAIIFRGPKHVDLTISPSVKALFETWGTLWFKHVVDDLDLLPGPYLVVKESLWQVLRLYDDVQGAFLVSVRTADQGQ